MALTLLEVSISHGSTQKRDSAWRPSPPVDALAKAVCGRGEPNGTRLPVGRLVTMRAWLLAGWQRAAMESAQHGGGQAAAPRNDTAPAEPPASWGVRVRLVAHVPGGRRLDPVTRSGRDLTLNKALDALVDAAEEAVRKWSGGTFGVTGRAVLTADGREQLRAEIARAKGGHPADVVGVLDAMEAITVAAEHLYEAAAPGASA